MKRWAITGGAGFIGSHLTDFLLARGDHVTVMDDFSTGSVRNIRQHLDCKRFSTYTVRVSPCNFDMMQGVITRCDGVFHLASTVGVEKLLADPGRAFRSIVEGCNSILGICAKHHKPVLLTSSSEVYGDTDRQPLVEDQDCQIGPPSNPRAFYAAAKLACEFMVMSLGRNPRLPAVIVRLFNISGARQSPNYGMVVPRFVRQALAGEDLTVYGTGGQMRCFAHVLDIVPALAALMECEEARGQVVNLGSNQETNIKDLALKVLERTDSCSRIKLVPFEQKFGPGFTDFRQRVPCLTKARQLVDYRPRRSLTKMIEDVIEEMKQKEGEGNAEAAPTAE